MPLARFDIFVFYSLPSLYCAIRCPLFLFLWQGENGNRNWDPYCPFVLFILPCLQSFLPPLVGTNIYGHQTIYVS